MAARTRPRSPKVHASLPAWLRRSIEAIRHGIVVRDGIGYFPTNARQGGTTLSQKAGRLRRLHAKGLLPSEAVRALERIRGWRWRVRDPGLQKYIALIRAYVLDHGWDQLVGTTVVDGHPIGLWVKEARRKGRRGTLLSWVRDALEAIPGWTWTRTLREAHDLRSQNKVRAKLEALRRHLRSPHGRRWRRRGNIGGGPLEPIVAFFRMKHRLGSLDESVERELEAIPGWSWDPFADTRRRNLALLRALAREHGTLPPIDSKTTYRGQRIGAWFIRCQAQYRDGALHADLARELETIPGWTWTQRRSRTEDKRFRLSLLKQFVLDRDLSDLSQHRRVQGVDLYVWVTTLRHTYRNGRLPPDWLLRELERLPGWSWSPREDRSRPLRKRWTGPPRHT